MNESVLFFFFSSRRRHTRCYRDWSSDVCSSDLGRPTDSSWVLRPKVPMSEETANKLAEIADALSTSERRVSPIRAHSIPACASYFDIAHSIWPLQTMLSGRLLPTQEKLSATFVKNPTPTIPFRAGGDTARPGNDPPHVLSS